MDLGEAIEANGRRDEDDEPQQSLFSWAEFVIEEPVEQKRRRPQHATHSNIKWALGLEQERERE